jgi:hypothetical protein
MVVCSRTRTINVVASNMATITNIEIEERVKNAITINVTGPGEYELCT